MHSVIVFSLFYFELSNTLHHTAMKYSMAFTLQKGAWISFKYVKSAYYKWRTPSKKKKIMQTDKRAQKIMNMLIISVTHKRLRSDTYKKKPLLWVSDLKLMLLGGSECVVCIGLKEFQFLSSFVRICYSMNHSFCLSDTLLTSQIVICLTMTPTKKKSNLIKRRKTPWKATNIHVSI